MTMAEEENDNREVDTTIEWDVLKAVKRGKLIAQIALLRARLELCANLTRQLNQSMYYLKCSLTIKIVSEHFWIITSIH